MARLLPSTPDLSRAEEAEPRVIGMDGEDADNLLAAISSDTARRLLGRLHDEPAAPSELADHLDTSLQNTQYHLGKLEDAGLVDVIDTVYSEKGREMKVFAPADRPLVLVAGAEEETATLRSAVTRLLGGLAIIGVASVVVQALLGDSIPFLPIGRTGGADGGGAGGDATIMATERAAAAAPTGPPPGLLFFAGAAAVLLVAVGIWYWRRR